VVEYEDTQPTLIESSEGVDLGLLTDSVLKEACESPGAAARGREKVASHGSEELECPEDWEMDAAGRERSVAGEVRRVWECEGPGQYPFELYAHFTSELERALHHRNLISAVC